MRAIVIILAAAALCACGDSEPLGGPVTFDVTDDTSRDVAEPEAPETSPDAIPDAVNPPDVTPDVSTGAEVSEDVFEPVLTNPPEEAVARCEMTGETIKPRCHAARYEFGCEDGEVVDWRRCPEDAALCVDPTQDYWGGCRAGLVDTSCSQPRACVSVSGGQDFVAFCSDGELDSAYQCPEDKPHCWPIRGTCEHRPPDLGEE